MTDKFTMEEIQLAAFKVTLENQALLRMLLNNQVAIMNKLDIDPDFTSGISADLMPDFVLNNQDMLQIFISGIEPISMLLQKRAWEWVKMNTNTGNDINKDDH